MRATSRVRYNGRASVVHLATRGASMFQSVEEVQQRFRAARYIAGRRIATVVYLAARMNRPVLIEGPAGVGKTELAKTLADLTGRPLIRRSEEHTSELQSQSNLVCR